MGGVAGRYPIGLAALLSDIGMLRTYPAWLTLGGAVRELGIQPPPV